MEYTNLFIERDSLKFMLEQLAQLLKTRKGKYILFLGAGASVTSGGKTTNEIVTDIVEKYTLDSSDPWNSFCTLLKKKSEKERFDILSPYFEDMEPSSDYKSPAKLIEKESMEKSIHHISELVNIA